MSDFVPAVRLPDGVASLLAAARTIFGEAHVRYAGFTICPEVPPYWLLSHMLEGTRYDLGPLLESAAFRQHCPDLAAGLNPDRTSNFEMLSPFSLSASLADALLGGGASLRRPSVQEAQSLARDFTGAVLCDHHEQLAVLTSAAAWSDWFACDVWDRTWILADQSCASVWL
ncbi:MAG: hypothetical protein AB7P40_08650, partial [Chloroflexota bacterium]